MLVGKADLNTLLQILRVTAQRSRPSHRVRSMSCPVARALHSSREVLSSAPLAQITTATTQAALGPSEPLVLYVWEVLTRCTRAGRARDSDGQVAPDAGVPAHV